MSKDAPEQLTLEFGRVDTISEKYPRRHEFRKLRTTSEIVEDGIDSFVNFVERPKVSRRIMGAMGLVLVTVAAYSGWSLKDSYEEYERAKKSIYEIDDYKGDFIDCSNGIMPNVDDLQYDANFDYISLYKSIALFDLESLVNLHAKQVFPDSLSAYETASFLDSLLEDSPIKINYDIDLETEKEYIKPLLTGDTVVTSNEITNLGLALNSIPSTLYEYAGIDEIKIVDEIKIQKSSEQLDTESEIVEDQFTVSEYNFYAGQYDKSNGRVEISKNALVDMTELTRILFHEVIGHGVMMKNCNPNIDSDWHNINISSGVSFDYKPSWKRTSEVNRLFELGIVVNGWYAGTNPREDVAETSTKFAPIYSMDSYIQYNGGVDDTNGSIVDEKARLIYDRISEIEPNLGRFLALQYELSRI